ncbi:MAG: ATP-binding cassette domain-containing protein [Enterocloster sp.]
MIPKLEVSHLCYSYHTMEGETEALSDLSFQVQTGEFLAVVGPSGCGKSTLLSLICGLLKPDSGRILLDGQPVLEGDTRIGYMLQKDHLFEWRTIRSNACLGLEIQKKMDPDHEKKVEELLKAYGLETLPARPRAWRRTVPVAPSYTWPWSRIFAADEPFSPGLSDQTRSATNSTISKPEKTAVLLHTIFQE